MKYTTFVSHLSQPTKGFISVNIEKFLPHFPTAKKTGAGWQAKCPAHDDGTASLCVSEDNGKILIHCQAGCKPESILGAAGLNMKDLFPEKPTKKREIVAEYSYTDEAGTLLYQAVRYKPKDFRQRRPDGQGGWIWNLKDVRLVPYQLSAIPKSETIFIVEGEKDCESCKAIKIIATCNPMGAGKWRDEFSPYFKEKSVVIIPDQDEPGREHAQDVARKLSGHAKSIQILNIPEPHLKDMSDWIHAEKIKGKSSEDIKKNLIELADAAPIINTKLLEAPLVENIVEPSKVRILGSTPSGDVLLYIAGKLMQVSTNKMTTAWVRVLTGIESQSQLQKIVVSWQIEANKKGIFDPEKKIGVGIWKIKDSWVIVSGVEALVISGNDATITTDPVYKGHVIEFSTSDTWLDLALVKQSFANGDLKSTFTEALDITRQWRWNKPGMCEYATALAILSPLQRALRWRPNVAISGPSGCGKSLFADEFLGRLWGPLVVRSDRATAHSVAQSVGSTAKILILDEFEKNRRIAEILDLLKLCGRGGPKTSGTADRKALTYEMRHLTWTLAAHLPAALKTDAAKANRTIKLFLDGGIGKPPVLPTDDKYLGLASRLIGTVIKNWPTIESYESNIDSRQAAIIEQLPGTGSRTIDTFRSASALIRAAIGGDWTIPTWGAEPVPTDGDMVLETILTAMMPGRLGTTIEQLLQDDGHIRDLEAVGIKIVRSAGEKYLAIHPTQARSQLLKGTDFQEMDISEALERLPGARKETVKFGMSTKRCVCLPFFLIEGEICKPCKPIVNQDVNHKTLISKGLEDISLQVYNVTHTQDEIPSSDSSTITEPPKSISPHLPIGLVQTCKPNHSNTDEIRCEMVYKTVYKQFTTGVENVNSTEKILLEDELPQTSKVKIELSDADIGKALAEIN
ncbi:MAG: hypothetical protein WA705_26325 [Candidatus Ozemobacteraceae bacterium]